MISARAKPESGFLGYDHSAYLIPHNSNLADDLLEGRGPGKRVHEIAALYRGEQFAALGLKPKENPSGPTGLYGIDQFTYVPEENCYICPDGKPLKYVGINPRNRNHLYDSTVKRCRECSQKGRCTRGKYRPIAVHACESARQRAYAFAKTPAFAISQQARRKGGTFSQS